MHDYQNIRRKFMIPQHLRPHIHDSATYKTQIHDSQNIRPTPTHKIVVKLTLKMQI